METTFAGVKEWYIPGTLNLMSHKQKHHPLSTLSNKLICTWVIDSLSPPKQSSELPKFKYETL